MGHFIPLSVPNLKGRELEYVTHAVKTEWVSTAGPYITEFEGAMAGYTGAAGAVACQSGTAGLHLALQACGVKAGDEVLVPTLTFIAAVNPVHYLHAYPVFVDCDDSLTLDAAKVQSFLENECTYNDGHLVNNKSGRPVTAIVVVHVFGNLADMEALMAVAAKYSLPIIEDATEALGSYYTAGPYKGKYAGTIANVGVLSFNGNKIITTGGGGMIISNNTELLAYCRYLSTQAKDDEIYFVHGEIGYNYRMTNLQAALGLAQLEQLEGFIATKKHNYELYCSAGLTMLGFREDIRPNYWFYSLMSNDRDGLIRYLAEQQVQTRPVWKLNHLQKPYENAQAYAIERALHYYKHIVNLPCSSNLCEEDAAYVAQLVKEY